MQTLYAAAKDAAEKLTQSRRKGFAAMNKEMKAALEFLNMPGIRLPSSTRGGRCPPMGRTRWNF